MSHASISHINNSGIFDRGNIAGLGKNSSNLNATPFKKGTFMLNGVKIEVRKGDTFQKIIERIERNKIVIPGITKITLVKSPTGDRLLLKSTARQVIITDTDKVLEDLHKKKLIGKGDKHLVQVIRFGINKNDVNIIYNQSNKKVPPSTLSIFEGLYNLMAALHKPSPNLPRNNPYGQAQLTFNISLLNNVVIEEDQEEVNNGLEVVVAPTKDSNGLGLKQEVSIPVLEPIGEIVEEGPKQEVSIPVLESIGEIVEGGSKQEVSISESDRSHTKDSINTNEEEVDALISGNKVPVDIVISVVVPGHNQSSSQKKPNNKSAINSSNELNNGKKPVAKNNAIILKQKAKAKALEAISQLEKHEGLKSGAGKIHQIFLLKRNYLLAHDPTDFMLEYKDKKSWSSQDKKAIIARFAEVI